MDLYLQVHTLAGTSINQTISDMMVKSKRLGMGLQIDFNGVYLLVWPHSTFGEVYVEWEKGMEWLAQGYRDKVEESGNERERGGPEGRVKDSDCLLILG